MNVRNRSYRSMLFCLVLGYLRCIRLSVPRSILNRDARSVLLASILWLQSKVMSSKVHPMFDAAILKHSNPHSHMGPMKDEPPAILMLQGDHCAWYNNISVWSILEQLVYKLYVHLEASLIIFVLMKRLNLQSITSTWVLSLSIEPSILCTVLVSSEARYDDIVCCNEPRLYILPNVTTKSRWDNSSFFLQQWYI